jgi:hypothetical protein
MEFEWTKAPNGAAICRTPEGRAVGGVRETSGGDFVWQCSVSGATVADTEEEIDAAKERVEKAAAAALEAL